MIPELSLLLLTLIANLRNYLIGKSKAPLKLDHILEISTVRPLVDEFELF
jgi:hypothetical protein